MCKLDEQLLYRTEDEQQADDVLNALEHDSYLSSLLGTQHSDDDI